MIKIRAPFAIIATIIVGGVSAFCIDDLTLLPWMAGAATGILATYWVSRVEG